MGSYRSTPARHAAPDPPKTARRATQHCYGAPLPHLIRCAHADLKGPRESAARCSADVDDPGVLSAADEVIVLRLQKEDLIGQVRSPCAMT